MLQFSARGFFWFSQYLESIKIDCYILSVPVESPDTPAFNMMTPLDDRLMDKAVRALKHAEEHSRTIGLNITADTAADLCKRIEHNDNLLMNCQWLLDQTRGIQKLAEKELKEKVFLYCPPERAKFFPSGTHPHAFGELVAAAFPGATYDISEAAVCLALARSSASVFHLMRTLEIGLSALGYVFGVSLAHTNWAPAIDRIEGRIRDMHKDPTWKALPDCKDLQEQYAQAASVFGVFKDAWRNHTMHVRGKYTEEEAEMIFSNIKAFMQKITALGLKEKP